MHQLILKFKASMPVNRSFYHFQPIKKIIAIGVVNFKIVKAFLLLSHFRDIFVVHVHASKIFFNMP